MARHREVTRRPEVVRALATAGVVLGVALLGLIAASGVRAFLAYQSVEREPFAQASAVREKISTMTPEQRESLRSQERDAELADLALQEDQQRFAAQFEADLQAGIAATRADLEPSDPFDLPTASSPALPDSLFASYLLVGSEGPRADSIIFVLLPSDGSSPIMTSLPRDLYVKNPCTDQYSRLNSGLGGCRGFAGGAELLSLMVQGFTGIEVDHFVRIGFGGFADVIDALGGVDICVDNAVRDWHTGVLPGTVALDISAGCSHVGGDQALAWVRTRHTEELVDGEWRPVPGASDLTREQHQQEMLFKAADRIASLGSLSAFSNVASSVAGVIHLDSRFAFGDAVSLAWSFRGVSSSSVRRVHVSVDDYITKQGAWVLIPTSTFNELLAKVYPAAAR